MNQGMITFVAFMELENLIKTQWKKIKLSMEQGPNIWAWTSNALISQFDCNFQDQLQSTQSAVYDVDVWICAEPLFVRNIILQELREDYQVM